GGLHRVCTVVAVVVEDGPSKLSIIRRRMRRFGLVDALGQALMAAVVVPILRLLDQRRIRELSRALPSAPIPQEILRRVSSVNDPVVAKELAHSQPDAVLVYGTRLIR